MMENSCHVKKGKLQKMQGNATESLNLEFNFQNNPEGESVTFYHFLKVKGSLAMPK